MADAAWDLRPAAFHTAPPYEHTFGPQVAAICRQAGFAPDPEQRLLLDDLFAVDDETGLSAAFEQGVIATRQNLKTGFMKQAAIGWLFVTQEEVVTWSAHLFSTTEQAFSDFAGLLSSSPLLRKRLAIGPTNGIHGARGSEHIELRDGRELRFRSRTKSGGRGLTGDKIILDEALFLQAAHLGTLIPTLTAVPDPQILYGSSAGLANSVILREIRDRGRRGSPGLAYAEWCARHQKCLSEACEHYKPSHPLHQPGCALDDEGLWAEANPLLGRQRINGTGLTLAKMRKFREAEPPEEWMRERLGWWDEAGAAELFGAGNWELTLGRLDKTTFPTPPPIGAMAIGSSWDLRWSSIGAAAVAGTRTIAQPLRHGPGQDWIVDAAVELQNEHGAEFVIDDRGPAAVVIDQLEDAGVRLHRANTGDVLDAFAHLQNLVTTATLLRGEYPELEQAVASATTRNVGDRTTLGRRTSSADISSLETLMLAAWRVRRAAPKPPPPPPLPARTSKRRPVANEAQTMHF